MEWGIFVNQDKQWQEHMLPIWAVLKMLQSRDDSHSVTHRHTWSSHSQSHVTVWGSVRQHNQWHWQSARSPGRANPVECLNINVKWWKLEFGARQVKQSEAWSEWQVTEGCAILLLVRTTLIGLSIAANVWGVLDLDRQNNPALDLTVSWVGRWWQHALVVKKLILCTKAL